MTYPDPEPGLVISYSFLWSDEAAVGHAEGRKTRPCAIVLSASSAAEPHAMRRVAVVLDELNVFAWPGFDLRHIPGRPGHYVYGYLPPRFLDRLLDRLRRRRALKQARAVRRE